MSTRARTTTTSRRDFLRLASIVGGSALLAACQQSPAPPSKPADAPKPADAKPAAPAAAAPTAAPAAKPAEAAKPAAPAAGAAPKKGGTLNYAEAADFTHFSPWSVTPPNQGIYNQVFNRLLWKDGTGKEHADIGESWEMAKDGLSFRVKMKQGVMWHDGKEHVAQDYVTMHGYTKDDTLLKDGAVKKHQGLVSPVKEVKAV